MPNLEEPGGPGGSGGSDYLPKIPPFYSLIVGEKSQGEPPRTHSMVALTLQNRFVYLPLRGNFSGILLF